MKLKIQNYISNNETFYYLVMSNEMGKFNSDDNIIYSIGITKKKYNQLIKINNGIKSVSSNFTSLRDIKKFKEQLESIIILNKLVGD